MKTSTPLHDAMVMSIDPEAIFEEIDAIADPMAALPRPNAHREEY